MPAVAGYVNGYAVLQRSVQLAAIESLADISQREDVTMPYVSCRYAPPDATGMMPEAKAGEKPVICTDDQGVEWFLTEDSQVGDWLRFVEEGGTVEPYVEAE